MRLAKLLGIGLVAASSACLSVAQNGTGAVAGAHQGCELTMQSNTLGGACGELVLHNTGSASMHGWQIGFELPIDGHLVNTWNANYSLTGNQVTVKPLSNEMDLSPGQSLTMGYCATGTVSDIVLTAGLCNNASGSDVIAAGTDSNTTAAPTQALSSVNDANSECPLDGQLVTSDGSGSGSDTLSVLTGSDGITRCAGARSNQTYVYGSFSAGVQSAAGVGVVTTFGTSATTETGLQGISVALDGNDLHHVWMGTWNDGQPNGVNLAVSFDTSAATHTYGIDWKAAAVSFSIDGVVVRTVTTLLPPAVGATLTTSAYATSFTGSTQARVINVRAGH